MNIHAQKQGGGTTCISCGIVGNHGLEFGSQKYLVALVAWLYAYCGWLMLL